MVNLRYFHKEFYVIRRNCFLQWDAFAAIWQDASYVSERAI